MDWIHGLSASLNLRVLGSIPRRLKSFLRSVEPLLHSPPRCALGSPLRGGSLRASLAPQALPLIHFARVEPVQILQVRCDEKVDGLQQRTSTLIEAGTIATGLV